MPIDVAVRQPRLRADDRALGLFGRFLAGQVRRPRCYSPSPRQIKSAGFRFVLRRQIQKRRQRRPTFHDAGRDELRNLQYLDTRLLGAERRVREHAVRGAQVDADDIRSRHEKRRARIQTSTSAGAMTIAESWEPIHSGNLTVVTFQPWWTNVPRNGPLPST